MLLARLAQLEDLAEKHLGGVQRQQQQQLISTLSSELATRTATEMVRNDLQAELEAMAARSGSGSGGGGTASKYGNWRDLL